MSSRHLPDRFDTSCRRQCRLAFPKSHKMRENYRLTSLDSHLIDTWSIEEGGVFKPPFPSPAHFPSLSHYFLISHPLWPSSANEMPFKMATERIRPVLATHAASGWQGARIRSRPSIVGRFLIHGLCQSKWSASPTVSSAGQVKYRLLNSFAPFPPPAQPAPVSGIVIGKCLQPRLGIGEYHVTGEPPEM